MTQPAKGVYHKFGFKSLIPASYAEWIEQLGANVIPIPYTLDQDQIKTLMYQLNGLLLPGGGTQVFGPSLYEFYRSRVYYVLDIAKELNEKGIHFPVWGTCMGYEQIVNWASGFTIWPTIVANYHVPRRVHWNKKLLKNSKFRKYLSDKDLSALENQQISFFNHKFSISKENFEKNQHLKASMLPIGETYSKEGVDFQSAVEGKNLPIFGTQFHPEKIQFEHTKATVGINISKSAVQEAKQQGQILVKETRKNDQRFKCPKLLKKLLIENFDQIWTDSAFESIYFFHTKESNYDNLLLWKDGC